jgi:hypothetical protein
MNTTVNPSKPTAADHIEMMLHESLWPAWPKLPLKNTSHRDPLIPGMPLTGFLVSGQGAKVYVGNIFGVPPVSEVKEYASYEAVLADGWVVD